MRVAGVYVPGFDFWRTRPGFARPTGCTPPAASRARHAHPGDRGAPGTPGGTEDPNFFSSGHGEPATGSLGVPTSHVTDPPEPPPEAFSKRVMSLYFPRACVALEALWTGRWGKFFFFPKTRFL